MKRSQARVDAIAKQLKEMKSANEAVRAAREYLGDLLMLEDNAESYSDEEFEVRRRALVLQVTAMAGLTTLITEKQFPNAVPPKEEF